MQFPRPNIIDQLAAKDLLQNALDIMAQRLATDIAQGNLGYCEKYVQEYVRQAALDPRVAGGDLRKAVYILIFEYGVLLNPSMEIVWDVVAVYGPQNSKKTAEFLNSLPAIYKPKFAKYLLHVGQEPTRLDQTSSEKLRKILQVFFMSTLNEIVTPDWLAQVKSLKTDHARTIANAAKLFMLTASAQTLVTLFPDLKLRRATELLEKSSLEEVTQRLFDDPSLISEPPKSKPRYVLLDKTSKPQVNVKQRTLQMALEYLDEDPDDTIDFGTETMSAADRKLAEQDKSLFQAYSSNPQAFEKSSRKTKERDQLRKKFDWTDEQLEGWAVMIKRDPKRQSKLAWTAEFGHVDSPDPSDTNKSEKSEKKTEKKAERKPEPSKPARKPQPKARYKEHHKAKPLKE